MGIVGEVVDGQRNYGIIGGIRALCIGCIRRICGRKSKPRVLPVA